MVATIARTTQNTSMAALATIASQLKVAREQALAGEYASAQAYFEGVIAQISR